MFNFEYTVHVAHDRRTRLTHEARNRRLTARRRNPTDSSTGRRHGPEGARAPAPRLVAASVC
jgi:hypothetical protein